MKWNQGCPDPQLAAIGVALKAGYRHFDKASYYGSEYALGAARREASHRVDVQQEEVFVTTKLWDDEHDDPLAAITKSLKNVQLLSMPLAQTQTMMETMATVKTIHLLTLACLCTTIYFKTRRGLWTLGSEIANEGRTKIWLIFLEAGCILTV